ncbi:hypothetical protein NQ314_017935 [Rhamnusium bicolor]|uniref:DNA2/NAM7 helicase-like C-terminal domain-containing protein n=1 Tax=Rhamnusium bicolor TaxID=1586634 RepID=A0AAV8WSZ7_9CUCU|nr:hypothetical protein NQ314_017935 [Rhamnusium bicolor]
MARFNVALTRAMSKLIIIGCAHVLGTDSKWSAYMELSEDLCAFFGAPYAKRTQIVMDDIVRRFGQVQMLDTQNNH